MLHPALDEAFDDLLTRWRVHHDLRRSKATPITRLAQSRVDLDRARSAVHRLRMALHPYGNDLGLIGPVVLCQRLDEVVHIPSLEVTRISGHESFDCICGERVDQSISPRGRRATA